MSHSESKTFTNIPIPKHIDARAKLADFANELAERSVRDWFSGNHFLDGYTAWDYLAEDIPSDCITSFADEDQAKINLQSAIHKCVSIRNEGSSSFFQVYRDSDTYGDEVHDWIVREFLLDSQLSVSSVRTCYTAYDTREGYSVGALEVRLDALGNLSATPLLSKF